MDHDHPDISESGADDGQAAAVPAPDQIVMDIYGTGRLHTVDGTALPKEQPDRHYDEELESLADPGGAPDLAAAPPVRLASVNAGRAAADKSPLAQFARRFSNPDNPSDQLWWQAHIESFGVVNARHPMLGPCVDIPYYGRDRNGDTVVRAVQSVSSAGERMWRKNKFDQDDVGLRNEYGEQMKAKGLLYGLDRIEKQTDRIVIVEGARDVWALTAFNLDAVGVPGSNMWMPGSPRVRHLLSLLSNTGILVIHEEPGKAGRELRDAIKSDKQMSKLDRDGRLHEVQIVPAMGGDPAGLLEYCAYDRSKAGMLLKKWTDPCPIDDSQRSRGTAGRRGGGSYRKAKLVDDPDRLNKYLAKVLDSACTEIRGTGPSNRNNALSKHSYKVGRYLRYFRSESEPSAALLAAAAAIGLPGPEAEYTVKRSLKQGDRNYVDLSDRD